MIRSTLRLFIPVLGASAAIVALSCSSEDSKGNGSGGSSGAGSGATGGAAGKGSGATGGSGGAGATGGTASDGGNVYSCFATQNTNPDPGGQVASGAECCGGFGTCATESAVVESIRASLGHADCQASPSLLCSPKDPAAIPTLPDGKLPTCTATYGALSYEGRCLPRCFTLGNPSAQSLGQGDCSEALATEIGIPFDEVVCAPCFNPLDATSTGACNQYGDTPADPAPAAFAECGSFTGVDGGTPGPKMGYCVPQELVANVTPDTSQIPQDTCPAGQLCAPKNKVENPNLCFAKCQATLGGEGACVATYIVEAPGGAGVGLSSALGQVTCAAGETCTPCISPVDNKETGACKN